MTKSVVYKKPGKNNEKSKMKSVPNEEESTTGCRDNPVSSEQISTYENQIQSSVIPIFHWDVFFYKERIMRPWQKNIISSYQHKSIAQMPSSEIILNNQRAYTIIAKIWFKIWLIWM